MSKCVLQIAVLIPNDSEPWNTLDLYTWDAETETWRWLPSHLDPASATLIADMTSLPDSIAVMQSSMVEQKITTEASNLILNGAEMVLTNVDVPGMLIGTLGGLTGDATQLPPAPQDGSVEIVPVVRNWVPRRDPNWALVSEMLGNEADRQKHVESLVGVTQSGNYAGLVLDYRDVPVDDRAAYARFVEAAATAFHENGLWLGVVVGEPQMLADGSWNTGGYDWIAIGAVADQVRVIMPLNPQDYAPGGNAEALLTWATSHVERYKLLPIFTTLSTDGMAVLTMEDVLASVSNMVATTQITESVEPGTTLAFQLGSAVKVEPDPETGATRVVTGNEARWLGSAQWLRTRLDLIARYRLGGAFLQDLLAEGNATNLLPAIADYQAQVESPVYALPEVAWEVTGPDGATAQVMTTLTEPQFSWTTPEVTGTYTIAARVAGLSKGVMSVDVEIVAPAPEITKTIASESESEDEAGNKTTSAQPTDDGKEEAPEEEPKEDPVVETEILKAAFVADVTVPDYTHYEKGEAFVKTWRLKNMGTVDWPEDTTLIFANGEQMGGTSPTTVGAVKLKWGNKPPPPCLSQGLE